MAYSERSQAYREKLQNGEYDLGWMELNSEWGVKATPGKRGLTLDDINVGSYGVIPKDASDSLSFAPRGADFDPAELPDMGYELTPTPKPGRKTWAASMRRRWRGSGVPPATSRGTPLSRCPTHGTRHVAALHLPHRGGVRCRRRTRLVAEQGQQRLP